MTKPDYLKQIDDVAKQYSVVPTYEQKLLEAWRGFEERARALKPEYDILNPNVPTGFIGAATDFIRLLYENDDAAATAQVDCDQIREKDAAYGGSWHSRGGTGAFHALARKGDRLVSMFDKHKSLVACRKDKTNSESIDDTIGDLRRYLILVVAWHYADRSGRPRMKIPDPAETFRKMNTELSAIVGPAIVIEEEPPPPVSKPCPECHHGLDAHDEDGCNGLVDGAVCTCSRKRG